MFAKLFTTSKGQFLIQKTESEEPFTFDLVFRYDVESSFEGAEAIMTTTRSYRGTDKGEEARDKAFDDFDAEAAEALAQKGI